MKKNKKYRLAVSLALQNGRGIIIDPKKSKIVWGLKKKTTIPNTNIEVKEFNGVAFNIGGGKGNVLKIN